MIRAIPILLCLPLIGCQIGTEAKPLPDQPKRICTHILKPDVKFIVDPNHEDTTAFNSFVGQSTITFRDEVTGDMMTMDQHGQTDWRCREYLGRIIEKAP